MAIAFGAVIGETHAGSAGTSKATTTSASVPSGGLIVVAAFSYGASLVTSVSGGSLTWAVDKTQAGVGDTGYKVAICSAQAPAGLASSTSITVNWAGSVSNISTQLFYITGQATSTPVDATGGTGYSSIGTTAATNVVTTNADDLIVSAMLVDFLSGDITPTAPLVEIYDVADTFDGWKVETSYRVVASTSTYTVGGSWTGNQPWVVAGVAYKAAASATVADNSRRRRPQLTFRGFR